MVYDNWVVGGIPVPHVRTVKKNTPNRTITLLCSALRENTTPEDPRSEIAQFEAMGCDVVTNKQLMNGGSSLDTCNGDPIILTDGVDSWVAALERIVIDEFSLSFKRIDYDLVIHYEVMGRPITYTTGGTDDPDDPVPVDPNDPTINPDIQDVGSKRYYAPFCGLSNVQYFQFSDGTSLEHPNCSIIGKLVISETRAVSKVNVYCFVANPLSGVKARIWIDPGQGMGFMSTYYVTSKLTLMSFDAHSASTFTIHSDSNVSEKNGVNSGRSIQIAYVEVVYE